MLMPWIAAQYSETIPEGIYLLDFGSSQWATFASDCLFTMPQTSTPTSCSQAPINVNAVNDLQVSTIV